MSSSSKRNVKTRKPRVLANIVKKPGKNFNTSGNNSFLNHSKNLFIESLRSNNAKLAQRLEKEKQRTAELFNENLTNKNTILTQKCVLREISYAVKNGVNKFKGALDLLIDASSVFVGIKEKITSFCPEMEVDVCPAPPQNDRIREHIGNVESKGTPVVFPNANSVSSSTIVPQGPTPGGPSARYGITRPMVQGQVISKPVISLQRVVLPHHPLGRGVVAPVRGGMSLSRLNVSASRRPLSRLSDVAEEGNEQGSVESDPASTEVISLAKSISSRSSSILSAASTVSSAVSTIASSTSRVSSSGVISDFSSTSPNISLPGSHVLLERLPASITECPQSSSYQICDDDQEQLTVVHFGSIQYTSEPIIVSPVQPKETSSCNEVPQNSPCQMNDSFQYSSESSEDEDLALQIVESKRQYLERSRQSDSKEGTSWNYDDKGKFHSQPPKKRKGTKNNLNSSCFKRSRPEAKLSSQKQIVKESFEPELNLESQQSEPKVLPSGKKSSEITSNHESSMDPEACPLSQKLPTSTEDPTDELSTTNRESLDMSFTACVSSPIVVSGASEAKRSEEPEEEPQEDNRPQISVRNIHVTQRSRGRKQDHEGFPESVEYLEGKSSNIPSSLVPVVNLKDSKLENNENFPPSLPRGSPSKSPKISHDKRARSSLVSTNLKDLTQSFVVLERLPDDRSGVSSFRLSESEVSLRPSNKYEKKCSLGLESPICVDSKAGKEVSNVSITLKHTLPLSSHSTLSEGSVSVQNSKLLTKQREEGRNLVRNSAGRNGGSLQSTPQLSPSASSSHQTKGRHELKQQLKSAVVSLESGSPLRKRKLPRTPPVNLNNTDSSSSDSEDIFESKSKPRSNAHSKDLKKDSNGKKVSKGSLEATSNLEGTKKSTVLPSAPIIKLNDQEWNNASPHFKPLKRSRMKKKSADASSEAPDDNFHLQSSNSACSQSVQLNTKEYETEGRQSDSADGHRPRRNAAPTCFKEPQLNTKMRRP